jgi:hypothetical protein
MKKALIKLVPVLLCTAILSFISINPILADSDTTTSSFAAATTSADATTSSPATVSSKHAYIPAKTKIELALLNALDSKTAHTGDMLTLETLDNIQINGVTVIPSGTITTGKITKAVSAGAFGKGGKLEFSVTSIKTLSGIDVPLSCNASYVATKQIQSSNGIDAVGSAFQNLFSSGSNVQCAVGTGIEATVTTDTDLNVSITDLSNTMQTVKTNNINITIK